MKATRIILIIVSAIALVGGMAAFWFYLSIYIPASRQEGALQVTVEEGIGLDGVVATFDRLGMVRSPFLFKVYAGLSGQADNLQAGDYVIATDSSAAQIIDILAEGEVIAREVTVTTIEGWSMTEVYSALAEAGIEVEPDEFEELTKSGYIGDETQLIYDGKPQNATLEGYLFPDTYEFFREASAEEILTTMVENFEKKLTPAMRQQVGQSEMTFFQVLTLASIVEKELRTPEERRIGAGIFLQRLADEYPLESDATVNYVTGKNTTRPSLEDLAVRSNYNTYTHIGLPPGPICNPGLESISAVLNPTETEYYFFLTTPEGEAVFTETFDQHLEQKDKYYPDSI